MSETKHQRRHEKRSKENEEHQNKKRTKNKWSFCHNLVLRAPKIQCFYLLSSVETIVFFLSWSLLLRCIVSFFLFFQSAMWIGWCLCSQYQYRFVLAIHSYSCYLVVRRYWPLKIGSLTESVLWAMVSKFMTSAFCMQNYTQSLSLSNFNNIPFVLIRCF